VFVQQPGDKVCVIKKFSLIANGNVESASVVENRKMSRFQRSARRLRQATWTSGRFPSRRCCRARLSGSSSVRCTNPSVPTSSCLARRRLPSWRYYKPSAKCCPRMISCMSSRRSTSRRRLIHYLYSAFPVHSGSSGTNNTCRVQTSINVAGFRISHVDIV